MLLIPKNKNTNKTSNFGLMETCTPTNSIYMINNFNFGRVTLKFSFGICKLSVVLVKLSSFQFLARLA